MSGEVDVEPSSLQRALDEAVAGQTIQLACGTYPKRLRMTGRHGRPGQPIVIRGKPKAVLDGGRNVHQFNPVAQRLAEATQLNRGFPGMQAMMPQGQLVLDTCSYIRIEGLTVQGAWPTGIFIDNCQHIEIRNVHVRAGTFAFAAHGELTSNLSIVGCSWVQDLSEGSLWRRIGFEPVHGDFTLPGDWRAFDGDFFRAYRIRGDVLIEDNTVEHAFNGVHLFNREDDPRDDLCRRVVIRSNRFAFIRDNTIEPETAASDWWIVNNDFQDCYKLVSLEMQRCGHVYLIGNRGWFTSMPGPEADDHTSGELLKIGGDYASWGPHYLLHNSWYLRGPLAKKRLPPGLVHMNNAILCCPGGRDWFCREEPPFLGKRADQGRVPNGRSSGSSFANDVVRHSRLSEQAQGRRGIRWRVAARTRCSPSRATATLPSPTTAPAGVRPCPSRSSCPTVASGRWRHATSAPGRTAPRTPSATSFRRPGPSSGTRRVR
ncbi:MAG: right-handed parallel beta-helix repeat-containing protein [Geminicoccaceae bacterium]